MPMLSLQEPVESPTLNVGRSEALILSVGAHLLIVLLFLFGPMMAARYLPQTLVAFLSPRPAPVPVALAAVPGAAAAPAPKQPTKIPLKFTYVSVPNDRASGPNPNAPLYSDKNRRARQEVPTPPDVKKFSSDPHSVGKSIDRVKPDPNRATGREDVVAENRPRRGDPNDQGLGGAPATERERRTEAGSAATPAPFGTRPSGRETAADATAAEGAGDPNEDSRGNRGASDGTGAAEPDPHDNFRHALSDLKSGEYKFQFNNPLYMRGGGYGTMSFDTQGYPWGDYARRIYLIIRNNWFERIPLAAREGGIRGWVCQRFVIEKNGTISSIQVVRPSGVVPFDKSSSDALSASSPLPSLPEDFPEPREGVTFCFYYNMMPGEEGE